MYTNSITLSVSIPPLLPQFSPHTSLWPLPSPPTSHHFLPLVPSLPTSPPLTPCLHKQLLALYLTLWQRHRPVSEVVEHSRKVFASAINHHPACAREGEGRGGEEKGRGGEGRGGEKSRGRGGEEGRGEGKEGRRVLVCIGMCCCFMYRCTNGIPPICSP